MWLTHEIVSERVHHMEASIDRVVLDRVVHAIGQINDTSDFEITLETRLAGDLKLGRMGRMRLGICLEEVFDIELSDEVLERAVTVADVVKYLSRRYYRDIDSSCVAEAARKVSTCRNHMRISLENWLLRMLGASKQTTEKLHRISCKPAVFCSSQPHRPVQATE
jgi:acyl carrier protein